MKKRLLIGVCVGALLFNAHKAVALVPVFDAAMIEEAIRSMKQQIEDYVLQTKQYALQNLQWLKQLDQYGTQVNQYRTEVAQLVAFVHAPNLGAVLGLLNQVGLGNSLPVDPYSMLGLVDGLRYSGGGVSGILNATAMLRGLTSQAYQENHVYTPHDGSWQSQEMIARANGIAGTQAAFGASYADSQAHMANLAALRARLATVTTPKDVMDLQAQIQVEEVWALNHGVQANAIYGQFVAQTEANKQRANEKLSQDTRTAINLLKGG